MAATRVGGGLAMVVAAGLTLVSATPRGQDTGVQGPSQSSPSQGGPGQGGTGAEARNAPPSSLPYVEEGACPFECCVYRDWRASRSIPVYEHWHNPGVGDRPKTVFGIGRGEVVTAMTGMVMTTKAGRVAVKKDSVLEVSSPRFIRLPVDSLSLHPGDTLFLLVPHDEGAWTAWFNGRLVEGIKASPSKPTPDQPHPDLELLEQPEFEWWVRVRNERGDIGWTDRARDFSGNNACSDALPTRGMR